MTLVHITARVTQERLLELPPEAQEKLRLEPGQQVRLQLDPDTLAPAERNEKMYAILLALEERHKDRPDTDGSDTLRLIAEARGGAMYGYDPTE